MNRIYQLAGNLFGGLALSLMVLAALSTSSRSLYADESSDCTTQCQGQCADPNDPNCQPCLDSCTSAVILLAVCPSSGCSCGADAGLPCADDSCFGDDGCKACVCSGKVGNCKCVPRS